MRILKVFAGTLALSLFLAMPMLAQKRLTASEAKAHVGETTTVCGTVLFLIATQRTSSTVRLANAR